MVKRLVLIAVAVLAGLAGHGQGFIRFAPPGGVCAGSEATLTFGYGIQNQVRIDVPQANRNHPGRAFLPDGVPCGEYGCSYRSPVVFSDFAPGSRIASVQDIRYVRLNIEHSFIEDIYIGITCPNGQKATIMRFGGSSTSSCREAIPEGARGWLEGNNVSGATYLGMANDSENTSSKCNPSASGNEPGVGWNYCWSNATGSGFRYASGDGVIYRRGHATSGRIDSSNVAAGTNFYHPDQSFSSLVGCPLNGTWFIEVVDGYSQDNGYIFDWELALDPSLLPTRCALAGRTVEGPWVRRLDDSTYRFEPPQSIASDTTVALRYRIMTTCGDTIDSVARINVYGRHRHVADTAACDSLVIGGRTYTHSTVVRRTMTSIHGCDSIEELRLTVKTSSTSSIDTCVVENALPFHAGGVWLAGPVADTVLGGLTNSRGCDSTVSLRLCVWYNVDTVVDTAVCSGRTPFAWNGITIPSSGGRFRAGLLTSHGADSTVWLNVQVLADSHSEIADTVVENQLPAAPVAGIGFGRSIDTTMVIPNSIGCDSTIHYRLTVWHNVSQRHDTTVCDPGRWPYRWRGVDFAGGGDTTFTLPTVHGADSTVELHLRVAPVYDTAIDAERCFGHAYMLGTQATYMAGHHDATLRTTAGCDSTVHLDLVVYPVYADTVADTACATQGIDFEGSRFNSAGIHTRRLLTVHGCDSLRSLDLAVIGLGLKAMIHASPTIVSAEHPETTLTDRSSGAIGRDWTVGDYYASKAERFVYTYTADDDSLVVTLVAYADDGCADTARQRIMIDRSLVAAPNAFTPTLDNNNRWQVVATDVVEMEVWIYNREGIMVAHLEGVGATWDGTDGRGNSCPQGSYVYTARYATRTHPDRRCEKNGTILLVK